ncbi:uncharacterized protein LOC143430638 [Xylocopa sonorina]|uniref:uncharacterized protein LOC143430638 n=1 Tax=Xylocopa sonorina TaxID=1818115 RepID=UPI00403AD630
MSRRLLCRVLNVPFTTCSTRLVSRKMLVLAGGGARTSFLSLGNQSTSMPFSAREIMSRAIPPVSPISYGRGHSLFNPCIMCQASQGVTSRANLHFSPVVYLINIDAGSSYNSFDLFHPGVISGQVIR